MGWFFRKQRSSVFPNEVAERVEQDLTVLAKHFALGKERSETRLPSESYRSYSKILTFTELGSLTEVLAQQTDMLFAIDIEVVSSAGHLQKKFTCNSTYRAKGSHTISVPEDLLTQPINLTSSVIQQLCENRVSTIIHDRSIIPHAAAVLGICYGFGIFHVLSLSQPRGAQNPLHDEKSEPALLYSVAFCHYLGINSLVKYQFYIPSAAWTLLDRYSKSIHELPEKQKFHKEWHMTNASAWDYHIIARGQAYEQETMDAVKRLTASRKRDYTLIHYLAYGQLQRGMYPEAIKGFTNVISANPFFSHAYNNRGLAYLLSGNFRAALDDLKTTERLEPAFSLNRRNFGIYWFLRGEYTRALEELEKAWSLDPKTDHIHYWLGKVQYELGNHQEAMRHFEYSRSIPDLPAPVYPM